MEDRKLEEAFLDKYVYCGLTNMNDGFDHESIKYFSESDFEIILDRVEDLKLGIYGIEPWKGENFYDVYGHESYSKDPTDPNWYRKAFSLFVSKRENLLYAATFLIPDPKL